MNNLHAFPTYSTSRPEMTLRDYFVAKLLPAMYRDYWDDVRAGRECPADGDWKMGLAIDAYLLADTMLKAREYINEKT